jgi:predicted  nucleic acid-binding Zn-ribbon protein
MSCKGKKEQRYAQMENGIAEMEAAIDELRMEIHELMERKDLLVSLIYLLKKDLKDIL